MRPSRLEVEGFGPFREPVTLDFEDAELFAFTGPTGSGKSSLVDAVVFALYGSVPRYGKREVAPVVTQGMLSGRVRLDFTLGGSDFTVVRSVRLDAKRKVTTEARLERGDEVLAGTAPEVTAAVEHLMGLDFDQFTTCVVLPQGDFERFLHARPAERQGLLVALLDLGVYERVREMALARQAGAGSRLEDIDRRLISLAGATDEALESARGLVGRLDRLLAITDEETPLLEELIVEGRKASDRAASLAAQHSRLEAVRVPETMAGLAARLDELRSAIAASEKTDLAGQTEVEGAEEALTECPDKASLKSARELWKSYGQATGRVEELEARFARTAELLESATGEMAAATTAADELRRGHEAEHLRSGLEIGDPCPVCERTIEELPVLEGAKQVPEAEDKLRRATHAQREADRAHAAAGADLASAREKLSNLAEVLEKAPAPEEIESGLERIAALDAQLAKARRDRDQGRKRTAELRKELDALGGQELAARRDLQKSLLSLAEMSPPTLDFDDLAADWSLLLDWVRQTLPGVTEAAAAASHEAAGLRVRYEERSAALAQACLEAGVTPDPPIRDSVFMALTKARAQFERLASEAIEAGKLGIDRETQADAMRVAKALAGHLRANNFEKWLLDEALRVLATGANRRLVELARGQYSLTLNARLDFEVIDHQSADERRSVQSLSGGETFLVSLALALSLADHIAEMSAVGTSRLEAILLDEGFGTLDSEALESVAAVISEIGAGGKMVGIISHVKGLTEMIPVRFEVSKDGGTSRVRRVGQ